MREEKKERACERRFTITPLSSLTRPPFLPSSLLDLVLYFVFTTVEKARKKGERKKRKDLICQKRERFSIFFGKKERRKFLDFVICAFSYFLLHHDILSLLILFSLLLAFQNLWPQSINFTIRTREQKKGEKREKRGEKRRKEKKKGKGKGRKNKKRRGFGRQMEKLLFLFLKAAF